ncbi:MAG: NAD-dependent epimerase/dehydratase family protein [Spirochaetia bacterium]|nr:NAD-dependent epimerase/dehydratase family protein [Spirochaetia bacterium]
MITGASGFIGKQAVFHFLEKGYRVRAHSRRGTDNPALQETLAGNLDKPEEVEKAFRDVDVILHLGGLAHAKNVEVEKLEKTNVEWTRLLVENSGSRLFVYLSSSKVYGESGTFREDSAINPEDVYARAKASAEDVIRDSGVRSIIFRPPLVYGAGVRANFLSLMRAAVSGIPLPLGGMTANRNYVYVGNLLSAIQHGIEKGLVGTYNVTDGGEVCLPDLLRSMARLYGRRARLIAIPPRLLRLVARLISPEAYAKISGEFTLSTDKLAATGFIPPYTLEDGLRETMQWYRSALSQKSLDGSAS